MEIKIKYETEKGIRYNSYYPTFYRNKDLREKLIEVFFNENNNKQNLLLLKERFVNFANEKKLDESFVDEFISKYLEDETNMSFVFVDSILFNENEETMFFMANIYHNMIKVYNNSEAMDLALFLGLNPDDEMALIIPKNEESEWIKLLHEYQDNLLSPPMGYRKENPLNNFFDDFNNNRIISNIVIHSDNFDCYYDEDDEDEDTEENPITEMENLIIEVVSSKDEGAYISLNEIRKHSVHEENLVKSFI